METGEEPRCSACNDTGWVEPCSGTGYESKVSCDYCEHCEPRHFEPISLKETLGGLVGLVATAAFFAIPAVAPITICGVMKYEPGNSYYNGSNILSGMLVGLIVTPTLYLPLLGLEMLAVKGCLGAYEKIKDLVSYIRNK